MRSRRSARTWVVTMAVPESNRCRLLVQVLFGDARDGGVEDFAAV